MALEGGLGGNSCDMVVEAGETAAGLGRAVGEGGWAELAAGASRQRSSATYLGIRRGRGRGVEGGWLVAWQGGRRRRWWWQGRCEDDADEGVAAKLYGRAGEGAAEDGC